MTPRVRVAALIRWHDRVLLCRQEKPGKEYWLLPGGGVEGGETLHVGAAARARRGARALRRPRLRGADRRRRVDRAGLAPGDRHVVHVVFGADLSDRSLEDVETHDAAVRGLRLFSLDDLQEIVLHPPMKRFVERWRPGDPSVYLGSLWIP